MFIVDIMIMCILNLQRLSCFVIEMHEIYWFSGHKGMRLNISINSDEYICHLRWNIIQEKEGSRNRWRWSNYHPISYIHTYMKVPFGMNDLTLSALSVPLQFINRAWIQWIIQHFEFNKYSYPGVYLSIDGLPPIKV